MHNDYCVRLSAVLTVKYHCMDLYMHNEKGKSVIQESQVKIACFFVTDHTISCDFEQGHRCGYTVSYPEDALGLAWQLEKGETLSSWTGAQADHTFKNASGKTC